MRTSALWWLGGGAGAAALLYWQIVLAEGAYLGPRAVRLIYTLGARYYDLVHEPGQTAADKILGSLVAQALAGRSTPRILDVATGTGRVPRLLLADPAFTGKVAALDLTPHMLAIARRNVSTLSRAVAWHVGEAGNLPWPGGVFDLVTCLEALEYFPRPRQAIGEMARVLRPGGTFLVSKVPDLWVRLLPGRALTWTAMTRTLAALGLVHAQILPWQQGHYELIIARKPA